MTNTKLSFFEFNNQTLETLNTYFHYFLCKHLYMYSSKMENDTLAGYFLSHSHIDFFNNSVTNSTPFIQASLIRHILCTMYFIAVTVT